MGLVIVQLFDKQDRFKLSRWILIITLLINLGIYSIARIQRFNQTNDQIVRNESKGIGKRISKLEKSQDELRKEIDHAKDPGKQEGLQKAYDEMESRLDKLKKIKSATDDYLKGEDE